MSDLLQCWTPCSRVGIGKLSLIDVKVSGPLLFADDIKVGHCLLKNICWKKIVNDNVLVGMSSCKLCFENRKSLAEIFDIERYKI